MRVGSEICIRMILKCNNNSDIRCAQALDSDESGSLSFKELRGGLKKLR